MRDGSTRHQLIQAAVNTESCINVHINLQRGELVRIDVVAHTTCDLVLACKLHSQTFTRHLLDVEKDPLLPVTGVLRILVDELQHPLGAL